MTIVTYFDQIGEMAYPFNTKEYFIAYSVFAKLCADHNVKLFFVRGNNSYLGHMRFNSGYFFTNDTLQKYKGSIVADIIYMKGNQLNLSPEDKALNNPLLSTVCQNKYETYKQFKKYMVPTYLITKDNYPDVLAKISTDKVVVKPVIGAEGEEVSILEKNKLTAHYLSDKKDYIAQPFIDSSGGIPNLVSGVHDIRLVLFNGIVKFCNIRQPKRGKLLANLAQGGSLKYIPCKDAPSGLLSIAKSVDNHFKRFIPRLYTIDFMYEKDKPYIVELNDQPGLPYMETNKFDNTATRVQYNLLQILTGDKLT
jgi:predicted ATP-grasp superfamily ATP-dependent carboligase